MNNYNGNGTEPIGKYINDIGGIKHNSPKIIVISEDEVDQIADRLEARLSSTPGYTDSRRYYCKVARQLPWPTLERLAITAQETGRVPGKLFTDLTKKEIIRFNKRNLSNSS